MIRRKDSVMILSLSVRFLQLDLIGEKEMNVMLPFLHARLMILLDN